MVPKKYIQICLKNSGASIMVLSGLLWLGLLGFTTDAHCQDPTFSQFYSNPLYLNPALAGTGDCSRIMFNYRNQWPSMPGNFVTYNASADHYVNALSGGIGIIFTADNAANGIMNTTRLSAIYAYHLKLSYNVSLNAGFNATYHQQKIKSNDLIYRDMIDPVSGAINPGNTGEVPIDNTSVSAADFNLGLALGIQEKYFIGFAVDHVSQPTLNFYENSTDNLLYRKYTVHAGARINLSSSNYRQGEDGWFINPNILYQQQQNAKQLNFGFSVEKSPLYAGFWYRHTFENPDGMIFLLGIKQKRFKFGYSYDLTLSKLKGATGGAHELSLAILVGCNKKRNRPGAIKCPEF